MAELKTAEHIKNENYLRVRHEAQTAANQDGLDRGLEFSPLWKYWSYFVLPQRKSRSGQELRCEVVCCEYLDRCQPGHGPLARELP